MSFPEISLYLHFPFCRSRCSYCDFVSHENRGNEIGRYVEVLMEEIGRKTLKEASIPTIYIGGGTPSLLNPGQLRNLFTALRNHFLLSRECEITLEANPDSLSPGFLTACREVGVNRLSIGVQSFVSRTLKTLGRCHTVERAFQAVEEAREAGFENLSLDLIFGVPGETPEEWDASLRALLAIEPVHVSTYSLTLEFGTVLAQRIEKGILSGLDPDTAADCFDLAINRLGAAGYEHYEISNFSHPGFECRHNLRYWGNEEYLGLGCAAFSYLRETRYMNVPVLDEYLAGGEVLQKRVAVERDTPESGAFDDVMMGMRRLKIGVDLEEVERRRGALPIRKLASRLDLLEKQGLILREGNRIRFSRRGVLLGDSVLTELL